MSIKRPVRRPSPGKPRVVTWVAWILLTTCPPGCERSVPASPKKGSRAAGKTSSKHVQPVGKTAWAGVKGEVNTAFRVSIRGKQLVLSTTDGRQLELLPRLSTAYTSPGTRPHVRGPMPPVETVTFRAPYPASNSDDGWQVVTDAETKFARYSLLLRNSVNDPRIRVTYEVRYKRPVMVHKEALVWSIKARQVAVMDRSYMVRKVTRTFHCGPLTPKLLFLDQTKPNGRPLGVQPVRLVVPNALKVTAENLMQSLEVNETTTANKPAMVRNPHAGKFKPVASSYLGNSAITGYSTTAWYLFADPNRLAAMEVAFLNGVDRPTVERADADFSTLGVQFRGYIDFGVKEQDYRAAIKMAGA